MRTHRQMALDDLDELEKSLKMTRICLGAYDDGPTDLWQAVTHLDQIAARAASVRDRCLQVSAEAFNQLAEEGVL